MSSEECHLASFVTIEISGSVLDSGTAPRPNAIMQFDGNDLHVADPGARLEQFDFGAFNVYFQQVD